MLIFQTNPPPPNTTNSGLTTLPKIESINILVKYVLSLFTLTVIACANPEDACLIMTNAAGSGTGFIIKEKGGFYLVSNQHVINGKPPHRYEMPNGSTIKPLKGWTASDRDIVIYRLEDKFDYYLEVEKEIDSVGLGEEVIIYGNSLGQGLRLSEARIISKSKAEIEVSGGIVPGNSGGPIIRKKTGKVIAVSTYATVQKGNPQTISDYIKAAALPKVRFYGVRIDTIKNPAEFDLKIFIQESAQIDADRAQLERSVTLLVLLANRLGTRLDPDLQALTNNADLGHQKAFNLLTPSGLYPGTYSPYTIEAFKKAGDSFFQIQSKPTAYILKSEYQNLVYDQRLLYSIYMDFLRAIPQR
jgi:hypothetical protein